MNIKPEGLTLLDCKMKEYWVNVYEKWPNIWEKSHNWDYSWEAERLAIMMMGIKRNYRLHVREFDTREAKGYLCTYIYVSGVWMLIHQEWNGK